jgi:hypothetical protein
MSRPHLATVAALVLAGVIASGAIVPVAGQTRASSTPGPPAPGVPAAEAAAWTVPLTAWGEPDLQGIWTSQTITPLERPAEFAGKEFLTEAEAAAFERDRVAARNQDRRDGPAEDDVARAYNEFWWDRGTTVVPTRRTSLIVDPPDGRIPYTADARRRQQAQAQARVEGPFNSWLDVDTGERCLTDGLPAMTPGAYNNNFHILQTPGYVVILHEMFAERRIIPLDGRPRSNIDQWLGQPRGRWEGNTLVVETDHFADKIDDRWAALWRASSRTQRLVERFTRVAADRIDYEFTIEDPRKFTRPWTAAVPLTTDHAARGVTSGRIYEYACHEGNYSLTHVLSGARAKDKADAAGAGSR